MKIGHFSTGISSRSPYFSAMVRMMFVQSSVPSTLPRITPPAIQTRMIIMMP